MTIENLDRLAEGDTVTYTDPDGQQHTETVKDVRRWAYFETVDISTPDHAILPLSFHKDGSGASTSKDYTLTGVDHKETR